VIKFFGLDRQYQSIKEEILHTTDEVLRTGQVLDGEYVTKFESAIANRCQRTYAIAVNSCTQALEFAQRYLQYKNKNLNNSILIPNISFVATINSVVHIQNRPILCDTDQGGILDLSGFKYNFQNFGIDAVMYVNLFGNIIDYYKLLTLTKFFNNDTFLIEDAAQSFGGSYKSIPSGKLGDVSCLSFDPTKNLSNYGSGGMLLTDDYEMLIFFLSLRDHGKASNHLISGTNSKMSELDSAHMLVKLQYFDQWQARRTQIANYYNQELVNKVQIPIVNDDVKHAWHKYVIRCHDRSALKQYLYQNQIETKIHYPSTLNDTFIGTSYTRNTCYLENSIQFVKDCLSLPIYPELSDSEVEQVVTLIKNYIP